MLRYCFCQKINYLQRTTSPPLLTNFVSRFDAIKKEIFESILKKPIDDFLWTQCCLDIQCGGLGYQMSHHVTPVAYIASMLEARSTLEFHFPGILDDQSLSMISDFHDSLTEYGSLIPEDEIKPTMNQLSAKLATIPKEITFQSILNEMTKPKTAKEHMDSIQDTRHLAWFDALRKDNIIGGRWLEVCPKTDEFTFKPDNFRVQLSYRLYLETPPFIDGSRCS